MLRVPLLTVMFEKLVGSTSRGPEVGSWISALGMELLAEWRMGMGMGIRLLSWIISGVVSNGRGRLSLSQFKRAGKGTLFF